MTELLSTFLNCTDVPEWNTFFHTPLAVDVLLSRLHMLPCQNQLQLLFTTWYQYNMVQSVYPWGSADEIGSLLTRLHSAPVVVSLLLALVYCLAHAARLHPATKRRLLTLLTSVALLLHCMFFAQVASFTTSNSHTYHIHHHSHHEHWRHEQHTLHNQFFFWVLLCHLLWISDGLLSLLSLAGPTVAKGAAKLHRHNTLLLAGAYFESTRCAQYYQDLFLPTALDGTHLHAPSYVGALLLALLASFRVREIPRLLLVATATGGLAAPYLLHPVDQTCLYASIVRDLPCGFYNHSGNAMWVLLFLVLQVRTVALASKSGERVHTKDKSQ
jgi:hypothetical protein